VAVNISWAVAAILNARDIKTGADDAFSSSAVKWVRFNHHDFSCLRGSSTSPALGSRARSDDSDDLGFEPKIVGIV